MEKRKNKSPEQVAFEGQRKMHMRQLKMDVEVLELDARFWEAKFKGIHYKSQFAALEAQLIEEQARLQAEAEDTPQSPVDISPEALAELNENEALQKVMEAAQQNNDLSEDQMKEAHANLVTNDTSTE
jgi:hypothetical protein